MKIILIFSVLFLVSCSEKQGSINSKLDVILQDDLKYMVAEVMKNSSAENVIEKPYYVIDDYTKFPADSGRVYSEMAVVSFYYFKDVDIKQVRKYRYKVSPFLSNAISKSYWDRFDKKLVSFNP